MKIGGRAEDMKDFRQLISLTLLRHFNLALRISNPPSNILNEMKRRDRYPTQSMPYAPFTHRMIIPQYKSSLELQNPV